MTDFQAKLARLNDKQREAVTCPDGPILILAGAGSGKTGVLTHRIAYLIYENRADLSQIFAVTFTNKAAAEMRHRAMNLLQGHPAFQYERELWVSTFHSACVRILRSDIHHLGYNNRFTIYDDSDQLSLIKACMKELNVSDQVISPKAIQGRINRIKNDGDDHETFKPTYGGPFEDAFMKVFVRYGEALKACGSLDFADLILMTVRLFQKHPRVLQNYQQRFKHFMIDEYQDTNRSQYLLMLLLSSGSKNIFAVGDEDQSIYRWRGADITNILNFEKDFPNAQVFKLEENYRSTKNIIEAASHVISHNVERRDKRLWTSNDDGEIITVLESYDEHDEAYKISNEVSRAIGDGFALNQMAIFYRTNAQSRLLEDILRAKGFNYQIYGGLKFYDRLEVKDSLAYMKLLSNPQDDVSFRRIINVPARGIGATSLEKFTQKANELQMPHLALLEAIFGPSPTVDFDVGRSRKSFKAFYELMEIMKKEKERLLPSDLLNVILEESGYRRALSDENTTESQSRLENLAELRQSIVEFELRSGADNPEKPITLELFLETIALVSDIDRFDPEAPALKMMTIHMAKGLEFDSVMIVGLEEELFPNVRYGGGEQDPQEVEEERRLFYVGMTRARKRLTLLFAKNRTVFGTQHFRAMSRFVEEIPQEYREMKKADYFARRSGYVDRPGVPQRGRWNNQEDSGPVDDVYEEFSQVTSSDDDFSQTDDSEGVRRGTRVLHPTFGTGVVRQLLGADKIMVEFPGRGVKKISRRFSQLKFE